MTEKKLRILNLAKSPKIRHALKFKHGKITRSEVVELVVFALPKHREIQHTMIIKSAFVHGGFTSQY